MGSLGTTELIIILVIMLLVFGSKKLPELARSLGRAQKEFKEGVSAPVAEPEKPEPKIVSGGDRPKDSS